jgi:hypothetical protein
MHNPKYLTIVYERKVLISGVESKRAELVIFQQGNSQGKKIKSYLLSGGTLDGAIYESFTFPGQRIFMVMKDDSVETYEKTRWKRNNLRTYRYIGTNQSMINRTFDEELKKIAQS